MQLRQYMSAHALVRSGDTPCRYAQDTRPHSRPAGRCISPARRPREDVDKCTREQMTRRGAIRALAQGAARMRTAPLIAGPRAQRSRRMSTKRSARPDREGRVKPDPVHLGIFRKTRDRVRLASGPCRILALTLRRPRHPRQATAVCAQHGRCRATTMPRN
jgi:hypothetical protein